MDEKLVALVTEEIMKRLTPEGTASKSQGEPIPLEVSGRHVHLSQRDVEALFGKGHALTPKRDLSQPGQFLCEERVRLVGPKGELSGVAVLGPARSETQAELSLTDAKALGTEIPVRMSGDLSGAGDLLILAGGNFVEAKGCAIAAKNHIHMTPEDAARLRVSDGERVRVRIHSDRPLTFEDVTVRVNPQFALAMHIDFDEADACHASCGSYATLEGRGGAVSLAPAASKVPEKPSAGPQPKVGRVVAEAAAKALCAQCGEGQKELILPAKTILTPLARDVFRAAGVSVKAGEALC